MRIKWTTSTPVYEVIYRPDDLVDLKVVANPRSTPVGYTYKGYTSKETLGKWLTEGIMVEVAEPQDAVPPSPEPNAVSIAIDIDTAPLEKTLALAKELKATLLSLGITNIPRGGAA